MSRQGELSRNGRSRPVTVPRVEQRVRTEPVLDVRCCVLSGCRFLLRSTDREGRSWASCAAGVHRATVPLEVLYEATRENASPAADAESPLLLRLLMAPECCRDECGVTEIERSERVIAQVEEERAAELFA